MFEQKVTPVAGYAGRFVRKWSGAEYMDWEDALQEHKLPNGHAAVGSLKATCIVLSMCDESGRRIVKGRTKADLQSAIGSMERPEVEAIFSAASELNGVLTRTDQVELAEGN